MSHEELVQYQIDVLTSAIRELRTANERQGEFNHEVVEFMASAATWGRAGLMMWGVGQAVLVAALVYALGFR
jgi:hypothetical protein